MTLYVGESAALHVSWTPREADEPDIIWSSSNAGIAVVDNLGKVTAIASGKALIYAVTEDGLKTYCTVTVKEKEAAPTSTPIPTATSTPVPTATSTPTPTATPAPVPTATSTPTPTVTPTPIPQVESLTLSDSTLVMKPGDTYQLTATVLPKNAADQELTWKSGAAKVVRVSSNGLLTAVSEGTATIRAMTANGVKAYCKVTVQDTHVTKVTLSRTYKALTVGVTVQLTATAAPKNAVDADITWSSSNKKIATVTQNGLVKAVRCGTCTITATAGNGVSASCTIKVKQRYVYQLEKSGVYRYTTNTTLVKQLAAEGWTYKKVFRAAGRSSNPVYWIYNRTTKRFQYTTNRATAVAMKKAGSKAGLAFYGSDTKSIPVYELCLEGKRPAYFYTTNRTTALAMKKAGWTYKGIAWYAELKTLS